MFDQYKLANFRKRDRVQEDGKPHKVFIKREKTSNDENGMQNIHVKCTSEENDGDVNRDKMSENGCRKWQERFHSTCDQCFDEVIHCKHYSEESLRLLIVGHNPSIHAWTSGYFYSNPSNRMWKLLTGNFSSIKWDGIVPSSWTIAQQKRMPDLLGVGFTDLGVEPGNDAAVYSTKKMIEWKHDFYQRLKRHVFGMNSESSNEKIIRIPKIICFTGKRQFCYLFSPPLKKVESYGVQFRLPLDWPLPKDSCEVWVLTSSSGRAAMTNEKRCLPYIQLAERLRKVPMPTGQIKSSASLE